MSTDAGIGPGKPHDVMAYAVIQFATATGDPVDALAAATSLAADALGLADTCGRLARGRGADLLVVRGEATRDPRALLEVEAVYRAGERVAGRSSRPPPSERAAPVRVADDITSGRLQCRGRDRSED